MVLAERFEVDAEHLPLGRPLEAPRELPLPERRRPLVATAVYLLATGLHPDTLVLDRLGVEVDAPDAGRQFPALRTLSHERDVVVFHPVLILREQLAGRVPIREHRRHRLVEGPLRVEVGVRQHLDVDAD